MSKNKTGWITEPDGTQKHYDKNGVLHKEDGPAEVRPNGTVLYYRNGSLHRDGNLPAMMGIRGTEKFAVDGKYHRLGGLPAITWSRGPFRFEWWSNGEIQRAQRKDGTQEWYAPGCADRDEALLHRVDGPAVIHTNGVEEFWLHGAKYPNRDFWLQALNQENLAKQEIASLDQGLIDEDPIDDVEENHKTKVSQTKSKTDNGCSDK